MGPHPAYVLSSVLLLLNLPASKQTEWVPCVELKRDLQIPCECSVTVGEHVGGRSIDVNCDGAIFTRDTVEILRGQPIVSISQRNSGYRELPQDLLGSGLRLRKLDLSGNSIRKLMNRLLEEQPRLEELRLADNLLGDSLNPIFSSNEFHGMKELKLLDLSGNGLRSIEEGIFKGCESLEQLYLDENDLTTVPTASLKGPTSIRLLSLAGNDIGSLPRAAFSSIGESLLRLDLSENELSHMEDGALLGLERLLLLNLSRNDLGRFNSDAFEGAYNLLQLDLSANFLQEFPTDAIRLLTDLRFLNISNNLIMNINGAHLTGLRELQVLDLSRNSIGRLGVNAFAGLASLTRLDLSLNALRTIEESSFEGLTKLKWLSLRDNNILLVPATALVRLPSLTHLHLEYNRIAALSTELIKATAFGLATLVLTRNLVREIPAGSFREFKNLYGIDLSGNLLLTITPNTFEGLEDTLAKLDVSRNKLTSIGELPLRSLIHLDLAGNQLTRVPPETFKHLERLEYLNLSLNPLYGGFPPVFPSSIRRLDVSRTDLKILPTILLSNLESLERIALVGNHLEVIETGTFRRHQNLSRIDLSENRIDTIENEAFAGLTSLYDLNLGGNRLTRFTGEYFDTGTGMAILDLSDNRIERLSATAFAIHPRLKRLDLSGNRLLHFPGEYARPLQFLEHLDLSRNTLKRVGEFAFSQIPRLRVLNLAGNGIESVDDLAFHNSTQLQMLDLSDNVIETLSERTMEGLLRVRHLALQDNRLATLPETIFDPSRVRAVESIDLSGNRFNEIPAGTLQRQSAFLSRLNVARNHMIEAFSRDIPSNLKDLDLSGNPLSETAINGILGEAKILRSLNLANTGAKTLVRLETPFLKRLNLSGNGIPAVEIAALERTTMLESLDLSRNNLTDFTEAIVAFRALPTLRWLDVSGNDARTVNETSFDGLTALRTLRVSDLANCTRIERGAFKPLSKLRVLSAHNYPKLGYFDVQGILKGMRNLETLDIEIKDSSVGNEQLSIREHPRLRELTLRGERLRNILSSSLVGVREPKLTVGIKNTSVDTIPAALFFPVPRSTELEIDLSGSKFTTISSHLLAALDERTGTARLRGLESNPIDCSCEARHLWKWLRTAAWDERSTKHVRCISPPRLAGSVLIALDEKRLSCNTSDIDDTNHRTTLLGTDATAASSTHAPRTPTVTEPEIIWTIAPTTRNDRNKHYDRDRILESGTIGNSSGTDDTLIIGIVGGVVALIAIIVIVVCICRLRWSNRMEEARMAAGSIQDASMIRPGSAYSGKINHDLYISSYNGSTLDRGNAAAPPLPPSISSPPLQMMPFVQPMHLMHTLLTPNAQQQPPQSYPPSQQFYGYCDGSSMPLYVTCSADTKCDR
ncbi:PREDICTED: chaoptin [Dufourea novaeangliae]|uniref:chaoptin n=1 Tax=Dufourea novaeangliae TaxID=178035 RepID=UPI000767C2F5|nr:PREDICTED: chaoptin [Dufourea novaeangliae]